jgi:hypothetical protein
MGGNDDVCPRCKSLNVERSVEQSDECELLKLNFDFTNIVVIYDCLDCGLTWFIT